MRPHRRRPTRLPCPWDSPGKNTGNGLPLPSPSNLKGPHQGMIVCIYFSIHPLLTSKSVSHSVMSNSVQPHGLLLTRLWSVVFSRQEYWSGLPFPPTGILPDLRIEPGSPALHSLFLTSLFLDVQHFSMFT